MVLFSISCDTCASRLNVKQQAAIGQVLACPKCGSMVLVDPPEGWVKPDTEITRPRKPKPERDPADSQATHSGELGNLNPSDNATRISIDPNRTAQTRGKNAARQKAAAVADGIANGAADGTEIGSIDIKAPPVQDGPIMPDGNWTSEATRQRKKALIKIVSILGGCLMALVLILFIGSKMLGGKDEQIQTASTDSENDNAGKIAVADDSAKKDDESKKAEASETAKGEAKKSDGPAEGKGPAEEKKGADDTDPLINPDKLANNTDNSEAKTTPADVNANPDSNPKTPTENDPPLNPNAALQNPDSIAIDANADKSLLDDFSEYSELIFSSDDNVSEILDATTDTQGTLIGIGKVFVPRPDPLELDLEAAMQEEFLQLEWKSISLVEFTRRFVSLTQIPMQIDSLSIAYGIIDPLETVEVSLTNVTSEEILNSTLAKLKLQWRWNEEKTVVIIVPEKRDELITVHIPVPSELASTEAQGIALVETVKKMLYPKTWNVNGGTGTANFERDELVVEQSTIVAAAVTQLVEKLGWAAKLKANPSDADASEGIASTYSRLADFRTGHSGFLSKQNEPIEVVLNHVQTLDSATVLMDWTTLLNEGWNHRTEMSWPSENQSFELTLRDLTSSMGLAYRMLDEHTYDVTSRDQLWNATRVEVYPCGKQLANKFTSAQIILLLQNGIAADLPSGPDAPFTRVDFFPQYDCIIAVLPDPLHIRTEEILKGLAEKE